MDEMEERRKKIREKINRRSSPELFGIVLVSIIFAFILFTSISNDNTEWKHKVQASENVTDMQQIITQTSPSSGNSTEQITSEIELSEKNALISNVPPPRIILYTPKNATTYPTPLPSVKFRVYGPYLDTVLLSIDSKENISIPNDGFIAEIEASSSFEMLNESFEEENTIIQWSNPKQGYTVKIDNNSYSGKHSLMVTTIRTSKGWSWISKEMNVIPGVKYRIVTHIKAENVKQLHIAIDGFDGNDWFRLTNVPGSMDGSFDWKEFSEVITIPSNVKRIRIQLNHGWSLDGDNQAIAWFDDLEIYPLTRVQTFNGEKTILFQNFTNGPHNITIFANNTLGNVSIVMAYFNINNTMNLKEKGKIYTIGDVIRAGTLEVKLKRFYGMVDVEIVKNTLSETYSRVDIEVKNIGDREIKLQFTPYNPVLIDNEGNTYDYANVRIKDAAGRWVSQPDQLKLDVLYPGAIRKGAIFFTPKVGVNTKNLTLIIYLNNEKYVFMFNRW